MADIPKRPPVTPAVRELRTAGVEFTSYVFDYGRHPGAGGAAVALGVPAHDVIKTLVMNSGDRKPLLVLMHGDLEVSTKSLARAIGVKSVEPATPDEAERVTGYRVGGISPFGIRSNLPVYAHRTVADLSTLFINGGKRGFLVGLETAQLIRLIDPVLVDVSA